MLQRVTMLCLTFLMLSVFTHGVSWDNWRGPNFNGTTSGTHLPKTFSRTENIKWQLPMIGVGSATPIIINDSIFLTSTEQGSENLYGLCIDRKTGKEKWRKQIASGKVFRGGTCLANSSPATDGKYVVFLFSTGDIACYDYSGKKIWHRALEKEYGAFAFLWPFNTSPVIYDGKCYVPVLQRDEPAGGRGSGEMKSYLLCMALDTGKTIFKSNRPCNAKLESREAYTTIIPYQTKGGLQLLLAGGDRLTSHDPKSGETI
jgi:hypothetical protein